MRETDANQFRASLRGKNNWWAKEPRPSRLLLHHDRQIHARVNCAIILKRATGGKGTKRAIIIPVEGLVVDRRAALFPRLGCTAYPGAVGNNVLHCNIIDQRESIAFFNSDAGLDKIGIAHMRGRAAGARCVVNATGRENGGQDSQQSNADQQFFIHEKKTLSNILQTEVRENSGAASSIARAGSLYKIYSRMLARCQPFLLKTGQFEGPGMNSLAPVL